MTGQSTVDVFKQAMVNEMQAERSERGDQESAEESILSCGPAWLVLALACGIPFLGSSISSRLSGRKTTAALKSGDLGIPPATLV